MAHSVLVGVVSIRAQESKQHWMVYDTGPKYQTRLYLSRELGIWVLLVSHTLVWTAAWAKLAKRCSRLMILSLLTSRRKFTKLSIFSLPLFSKNDTSVVWCHATTNKEPKGETQSSHKKWDKSLKSWASKWNWLSTTSLQHSIRIARTKLLSVLQLIALFV